MLSSQTDTTAAISILYHVRGAVLLSQYRSGLAGYDASIGVVPLSSAIVFGDVVRLLTTASVGANRTYEFIFVAPENQPGEEAVEEITSTGVVISVYNEHGVLVCRNTPKTPASGAPAHTDESGEMASEPIDGTGEMTSEPIGGIGETTSEPIDGTGDTI